MNNKDKNNFTNIFVLFQAVVVSGIYLYNAVFRWNVLEYLTVFLYPIYQLLIIIIMLLSFVASLIYLIRGMVKRKATVYRAIPPLVNIVVFAVSIVFFNEVELRKQNFMKYQAERQQIVKMIERGKIKPDEQGAIKLPNEMKSEGISRNGTVYLLNAGDETGIYFCTFTGILETSSGFVYFTEIVQSDQDESKIIKIKNFKSNWYFCSTD